jgi:hypothetical protein
MLSTLETKENNMSPKVKPLFTKAFKGQGNFVTPTIIRYGEVVNYVYELSEGRGFLSGGMIYGVTLLTKEGERVHHKLSKCFSSRLEALDYIDDLNEQPSIWI